MLIESLRKNSGKINFDVSIDPLENVAISEFVSSTVCEQRAKTRHERGKISVQKSLSEPICKFRLRTLTKGKCQGFAFV